MSIPKFCASSIAMVFALVPTLVCGMEANGVLTLVDELRLPAETSGVLEQLLVKEGVTVSPGQLVAKVNNSRAILLQRIARLEAEMQQQMAHNDARIRATQSQAEVSAAEYQEAVSINERVSQAIPLLKVRRLMLSAEHARLEVEVAQIESEIDVLKQSLKQAELQASEEELSRCQLHAPLGGVVVECTKHRGEWVSPGEPVLRIVRMDRLRVEWLLKVSEVPPHRVAGREIIAKVKLSQDEQHQVRSKISFVSPLVEPTEEYRVWAEFANPVDDQGNWLLRPGLEAVVLFADSDQVAPSAMSSEQESVEKYLHD